MWKKIIHDLLQLIPFPRGFPTIYSDIEKALFSVLVRFFSNQ